MKTANPYGCKRERERERGALGANKAFIFMLYNKKRG